MAVMHVPYGGEVDVSAVGTRDCQLRVRCGENVVVLVIPDDLLRQLVAKANRHLDRRAAELALAMLEAERERRRRGKRTETLAAQVVVLEDIRDSKTAPVAAGPVVP